jgi:hypothetical protein
MNFYKSKIYIIGSHKITEILINNLKKIHYSIFDFYKWNETEFDEVLKIYN